MKNWLDNKTVIITGASSGIGKELTKLLISKYNCNVLGVARNEEKLKFLKQELKSFNDNDYSNRFDYVIADVSQKEDWQNILKKGSHTSLLINNAGTMPNFKSLDKFDEEEIDKVFNTNFKSIYYGYKTFIDLFRKKENCGIVNITSSSALCSIPGQSVYTSSKSAATALSKIISGEEKGKVFIATYLPGTTKTNLFVSLDNKKPVFDEKCNKIFNKISMKSKKLANKIAKSILKKKRYKIFGFDSKLLKFFNWLMPSKSTDIIKKAFQKTKFECFEDIFN